jgi:endonuclease III
LKDKEIHEMMAIITAEVPQWQATTLAQLVEEKRDAFRVLIATLLSLRTQDKTTHEASGRLFLLADTPEVMVDLPVAVVEKAIYPVGFYTTKAKNIISICRILVDEYDGRTPDDLDELLALPGVGRKTANLVITLGFDKPGICVDTHVHRIANRWGYVATKTPDETEFVLRDKLPAEFWIPINDLLVTYGQNLCKPISPFCSKCRLTSYCPRLGVEKHR